MMPTKTVAATITWLGAVVLCAVAGGFAFFGFLYGPSAIGHFLVAGLALAVAFTLLSQPVRRNWLLSAGLVVLVAASGLTAISYRDWHDYTDFLSEVGLWETDGNISIHASRRGFVVTVESRDVQAFAPVRLITAAERGEGRYMVGYRDLPQPSLVLYGTPEAPRNVSLFFTAGVVNADQLPAKGATSADHRKAAVDAWLKGGHFALRGRRIDVNIRICGPEMIEPEGVPLPDHDIAFAVVGARTDNACGEAPSDPAAQKATANRQAAALKALGDEHQLTMDFYGSDGTRAVTATFDTSRLKAAYARADLLNDRVRHRDFGVPFTPWFIFTKKAEAK